MSAPAKTLTVMLSPYLSILYLPKYPYKSPFRRLSVGGTNSNESLSILHVTDKIILKEAILQSTGR